MSTRRMYLRRSDLIAALGDDDAFARIVALPMARNIVDKFYGRLRLTDLADDLESAACLAIWRARTKVDPERNPFSFLTGCGRRACHHELSAQKKKIERQQEIVETVGRRVRHLLDDGGMDDDQPVEC